jgi:hypothetical protein
MSHAWNDEPVVMSAGHSGLGGRTGLAGAGGVAAPDGALPAGVSLGTVTGF